jgi:hypothetical protein
MNTVPSGTICIEAIGSAAKAALAVSRIHTTVNGSVSRRRFIRSFDHLVGDCAQAQNPTVQARRRPRARIDGEGMPWRRPLKLLLKNYSIISVTRTKNDSGMVKPSAFAVVLLKTRSNLSGCSTGMSAGFEPRRILST